MTADSNADIKGTGRAPFLIVIGRQYGSGGARIGRMLAESLGVPYYDKTLLSAAAESLGYTPEIFSRKDERKPSFLRSFLSFNYGASSAAIDDAPMSDEKIYEFQSRVIRDICSKGSCVIVGRTADYVMRHHPRMVSLFIHAPLPVRGEAVRRREGCSSAKEGEEIADRRDRDRQSYYNYYTNRDAWGRADNYHLSFDSSRIPEAAILEAVRAILEAL